MSGDDAIEIEGIVMAVHPNGTMDVAFSNGHRVLGYLVGRDKRALRHFERDQAVTILMSPYDFSRGRIVVEGNRKS